jgi:GT2 family glycosyltransferase
MSAEGRPPPQAAATPAALAPGSIPGSAPVLSILVISYNTRAMTLDCLRTVVAETRTPYELIVLDNASADGSAEAIAAEFPEVRLIASPENLGFAEGNNVAARVARGEYLLLLNPDTLVLRGALDKLLGFARAEPQAGIWGGRTLFADGSLNPSSCWRRLDLWALAMRASGLAGLFRDSPVFNAEAYGGWRRDSPREVDVVTGCLFLIRRESWDRLGGFDPSYVMYGDEADLCRRAQTIGLRPMITPEAEIVHYAGASETVRADKLVRLYRALMTLIRRHFPPWQRPLARALLLATPLTRTLALAVLPARVGRPGREAWRELWVRRAEWRDGYLDRS